MTDMVDFNSPDFLDELSWKSEYDIGDELIDSSHRRLFAVLRRVLMILPWRWDWPVLFVGKLYLATDYFIYLQRANISQKKNEMNCWAFLLCFYYLEVGRR